MICRRLLPLTLPLFALAVLSGCDGGPGYVPVSGTVKFADGSVPQGEVANVNFAPVGEGKAASGDIRADGSFELMSVKPGDGVLPGEYKVVVKVWKTYAGREPLIAEKFSSRETTPLTATVTSSGAEPNEFIVEKP